MWEVTFCRPMGQARIKQRFVGGKGVWTSSVRMKREMRLKWDIWLAINKSAENEIMKIEWPHISQQIWTSSFSIQGSSCLAGLGTSVNLRCTAIWRDQIRRDLSLDDFWQLGRSWTAQPVPEKTQQSSLKTQTQHRSTVYTDIELDMILIRSLNR